MSDVHLDRAYHTSALRVLSVKANSSLSTYTSSWTFVPNPPVESIVCISPVGPPAEYMWDVVRVMYDDVAAAFLFSQRSLLSS